MLSAQLRSDTSHAVINMPSTPTLIGTTTTVAAMGLAFRALVDTGADSCAVHCSRIAVRRGCLTALVANERGALVRKVWPSYHCVQIHSIAGIHQLYAVRTVVRCHGVAKRVEVVLQDRWHNPAYPFLLGRNFLSGHFCVDVSR